MIEKIQILEALKTVIDPELHINIVDLGLIYDVDIKPRTVPHPDPLPKGEGSMYNVEITMTLTTPGCPLSMVFEEWIPKAVKEVDGVKSVMINLVWEPAWDPEKISDDMKEELGLIK